MAVRDGDWELDHELSIIGVRYVWKLWDGEKLVIRTDYPVDTLVEANQTERNAVGDARFGEVSKVASIPAGLFYSGGLNEAFQQQDTQFLKRWLNDGDNAAWRTREGQI